MAPVYRESRNKKRWMVELVAASFESSHVTTPGLATGWGPYYVPEARRPGERLRMNGSMPKLFGFIVLAAIILATGFGAMG